MKIFSTLILLLASIFIFAQDPTITWKELSKDESQFRAIVTEPGSNNLVKLSLQKEGKKKNTRWHAMLTKYDASLTVLQSAALANPTEEGKYAYLLQANGKTYAVFSKEEDDKVYAFSVQQIDLESLQAIGKLVTIGTFQVMSDGSPVPKPFLLSEDGKSILFFGFVEDEKANTSGYTLVQFDDNMQEKWRKTLTNQKGQYHRVLGLTNKGIAICTRTEPLGGKSLETTTKLLQVASSATPDEIPIDIPGQSISSVNMLNETSTGYRLFGLSAQDAGHGYSGYFTAEVNAAQKIAIITSQANFDLSLLTQLAKQEEAFGKPLQITPTFQMVNIIRKGNGSIHVVLENSSRDPLQYIRDSRNIGKRFIPESEIVWLNMSILDIVVHKDGSSNVNYLSKQQYSDVTDRLGSGFALLAPQDDLFFFYNGWRKNIENGKPVERGAFGFADYSKSSFVFARMEKDGSIERKVLFDNKPNGFYPSTVHFFKISDSKMIVVGQTVQDPGDVSKEALGILEIR